MRIGLVSLNQEWLKKKNNQTTCSNLIKRYKSLNIELIIFPEMTLTGFCTNEVSIGEFKENSETIKFFDNLSKVNNISIIFGLSVYVTKSKLHNSLFYINPLSSNFQSYAKVHPFTYSGEKNNYKSGDQIVVLNHNGIKLGSSICYDLRFPILFNLMSEYCSGAICIANWPSSRINHWYSLLKSRAIENQFFMIGVNRDGKDGNNIIYEKSSVIFSPSGEILKPVFTDNDLDVYEVNFEKVSLIRQEFNTINDNVFKKYFNFNKNVSIKIF